MKDEYKKIHMFSSSLIDETLFDYYKIKSIGDSSIYEIVNNDQILNDLGFLLAVSMFSEVFMPCLLLRDGKFSHEMVDEYLDISVNTITKELLGVKVRGLLITTDEFRLKSGLLKSLYVNLLGSVMQAWDEMDNHNKDSVRQLISAWLNELNNHYDVLGAKVTSNKQKKALFDLFERFYLNMQV